MSAALAILAVAALANGLLLAPIALEIRLVGGLARLGGFLVATPCSVLDFD